MSNEETTGGIGNSESGSNESGKGRPTPKRKESESARKQGISVPKDPKAARRAASARDREARAKSRAGLMAGDPAYFPRRDAGPVKAQVRDYVDRRRTVGEFFVPFAFVVLLLGLINNPTVQTTVVYVWTSVLLPSGSVTTAITSSPPKTACSPPTKPGPPSDNGAITTSSSG